ADRRASRRHDHGDRDRPRTAFARGEGGAVRGGAVRRRRARDGLRRPPHLPGGARASAARDRARADVRRPGSDLRPRAATDRGGGHGERDAARPGRVVARARRTAALSLAQLVAPRRAAARPRHAHDRRGAGGVRMTTGALVLEDGTVFGGEAVGAPGFAFGEAVFTTSMTGYQEVAT